MRFLKSISKWLVLTFGTISLVTMMGVGAAGIYFKKEAIHYYTIIRDETQKENNKNIFTNIRSLLDNFKNSVGSTDQIDTTITEANNQITELDNIIKQLEQMQKNNQQASLIFNSLSSNSSSNINDLISKLKSAKEQLQTSITQIQTGVNGVIPSVQEFIKPDGPADKINGYVGQAEGIFEKVTNIFAETPPDKFEQYYSIATIALTAIPATILGFGLIGTLTGVIFYTKVDGKIVRRGKVKEDLAKHIKKIVKKYPDILTQIK